MKTDTPQTIYLKDYTPPAFMVNTVDLDFVIETGSTTVTATLAMRRNPAVAAQALVLDGDELETLSVAVDGQKVPFLATENTLTIAKVPDAFTLQTVVRIQPDKNTRLSGLYRSKDGYFTQCEAQGFRRITWFLDRPDVMSTYTVTLHADKATLPVLLANGNPVAAGDEADGHHWARWADPFKKPAYLFAVVAGKLDGLFDSFTTASGRSVQLAIYVEPGKLDQCPHAMAALQKSMKWDEERFGLECDLDHYMIVAVGDFNMGAMENKGLNIFNTKYVLARSDVATDVDFENIDRVVAHEYFHNWTGNRVTCRDWFQLSLKEGLTVFRDQEFGADLHNRSIARIREVRGLRAGQFPEDAGPMAHPVRPSSFVEINNFYTATVYEKGAEVIRMIQTLIGRDGFRKGMDEYFLRHDGQAVTCEDFVAAMAAASGFDFTQFMRWYNQPGTPHVAVDGYFDAESKSWTLTCTQANPRASDQAPYLIPIRVALFTEQGELIAGSERLLQLTANTQSFVFNDIATEPTPSLLRDFSAPVYLDFDYTPEQLTLLLAHESDPFNAWEAGQRLASTLILDATAAIAAGQTPAWPVSFVDAARRLLLTQAERGAAFVAEALILPGETTLAEAHGRSESGCPARRPQCPAPPSCRAARRRIRRPLRRAGTERPLRTDQRTGRPPRPAQRLPRLPARTRHPGHPPDGAAAILERRQHDRPVRGAGRTGQRQCRRLPGTRDGADRLLHPLAARGAGRQQVAGRAIDQPPPGHPGHGQGAERPPGLRHRQPEQGVCADPRLRRQPAALQRRRRQRLRLHRRPHTRSARQEPASRLAPRPLLRPLEEIRRRPPGARPRRAGAHPRPRRPVARRAGGRDASLG